MSSSGTSTPRDTALTPPPGGGDGPSPLVVGTRFVKQYYQFLTTSPDKLNFFYQPTSVLSKGQGSQPTQPATFETHSDTVKDRFVLEGFEGCPIRFEFEHGAIDAQVSVNGGVLLVVTGHIVYLPKDSEDDEAEEEEIDLNQRRKAFVHTFFLGSMAQGTKRKYYIQNDVLRFLKDVEETPVTASAETTSTPVPATPKPVEEAAKVEAEKVPMNGGTVPAKEVAPGGGVEETKETVEDEAPVPVSVATPSPEKNEASPGGGVEETKEVEPADEALAEVKATTGTLEGTDKLDSSKPAAKPPTPGSWASVAASAGSAPTTPTPGTPSRPTPKPKPSPTPAAPPKPKPTSTEASSSTKPDGPPRGGRNIKRDPDCTLVIKNLDAATTEPEVIGLFEPFAVQSEGKIVGITVAANKNIAFVDYDTAAPVLKAVEKHEKDPIQLHGRKLEMYQKSLEQGRGGRGRGGRGYHRGGGGSDYRGSASGRQQYRRDRGGRGDRGGSGSAGRSGRGGR